MHIQRSLLSVVSVASAPLLAASMLLLGCSSNESSGRTIVAGESQFGIDGAQSLTSLAVGEDGAIALTGSFDHTISFGDGKLESAGGQDVFVAVLEPSGEPRWSGRTGSDYRQEGTSIALTKDGEVLLAGNFTGTVSFSQGERDKFESMTTNAFLCRFDRNGNAHWSKMLGDPFFGSVRVAGIALAPDDSVVVGGSFSGTQNFGAGEVVANQESSFIARYDAQGRHVFSLAFAGQLNKINALTVDPKGAVIFGGDNRDLIIFGKEFSSQGDSGFVGRLEPDGTPGWFVQLGGFSAVSSVAVSEKSAVVLGGVFSGTLNFGDKDFSGTSQTAFVAKLSSTSAPLWFNPFIGADYASRANIAAVAVDSAEHTLFTGSLRGTVDLGGGPVMSDVSADHLFLAELDANGAYQRSKGFGGSGESHGSTLAVDPAGGVVYGGTFDGKLDGAVQVYESRSPEDILVIRQSQ